MCVLYVSFGFRLRPSTFGCIAMGSVVLVISGSSSLCHQTAVVWFDVVEEWIVN